MDKEVELILTKLRIVSEEEERGMYLCDKEHSKLLLDYITNLQERKITKEDVDKYFEENMMVSFDKFIENWKEQEEHTKYLQEENEILKLELSGYREAILRNDELLGLQDYKSRNEKAKKYIIDNCVLSDEWKELGFCNFIPTGRIEYKQLSKTKIKYLLNILNGGDDSE